MSSSPTEDKKLFASPPSSSAAAVAAVVGFFALLFAAAIVTISPPHIAFAQTPVNPQGGNNTAQTTATAPTSQVITGSINIRQAAKDLLNENLNATFVDAADIAEDQVANGTVISGHLSVLQGYLVYDVIVANVGNDTAYNVIVDPSNGRVLVTKLIPAGVTIGGQAEKDFLGSGNATVTLVDAADVAEKQVPTGMAIAGSFEMSQGNPLYNVTVADIDKGMLFHITVDPRTGSVLTTSQGVPMGDLSIKDVF